MNRSLGRVAVLALGVLIGGCASTSTVDIGYTEAKAARGPLSTVSPRRIAVAVTDRRPLPGTLVGFKKGEPPRRIGPIVAERPIREIVHDALATELGRNNHVVVASGEADRYLTVDVREFWLDMHEGFWAIRFSGTVAIIVTVADSPDGRVLITRAYQGHAVEHGQWSREGNWKPPLDAALDGMIREAATDVRLVEALRSP